MDVIQPYYWLIAVAVLLIIEIVTVGLTTIWFAAGAFIAFLAALLGAGDVVQVLIFIAVSILLLIFTRPWAVKYLNGRRTKTNYESLIGKKAKVTERIDNFNETGTVVLNGQEWTARADGEQTIEPGSCVAVKEIRGVKLIVSEVPEKEE
ncbi:NfeD family protein [Anaerolentibacter hominis]|uniref:NfeD family protein n=1 Tax=Anaerolentibacter hominis TaxID=3079009 RepID=UPI0031B8622B